MLISIYLLLLLQFTNIVPTHGLNFLKALNPLNWRFRRGHKSLVALNDTRVSDFAEYSGLQVIDLYCHDVMGLFYYNLFYVLNNAPDTILLIYRILETLVI